MEIGGVTAFALPDELPIWVDAAVMARERIILGGGSRAIKVLTPPSTLTMLDNVTVIDDLGSRSRMNASAPRCWSPRTTARARRRRCAACADAGLDRGRRPDRRAATRALQSDCNCVVIDLRSRHVTADEARRRITSVDGQAHRVHKIDSTLRGNWAAEVGALVDAGRRVVMIPSHPRAGRICAGGVVYVNGVPVAESELGNDPRLPVRNSRPSESLTGTEISGPDELAAWLATSRAELRSSMRRRSRRSTNSPRLPCNRRRLLCRSGVCGRGSRRAVLPREVSLPCCPIRCCRARCGRVRQPASRQSGPDRQGGRSGNRGGDVVGSARG